MRKIVRSELFNEELKELIKNPGRTDEFVKGAGVDFKPWTGKWSKKKWKLKSLFQDFFG